MPSPVILQCHVHSVIPILSPVIFTPSLYTTLVTFKERFIYLFTKETTVFVSQHRRSRPMRCL